MNERLLPDNTQDGIKQRKARNTLVISGMGVLLFEVWTVVKILGSMLVNKTELIEYFRNTIPEQSEVISDRFLFGLLLIITCIILSIGVMVRLFIGLSAIAEGRRNRRGKIYLPLTAVLIFLSFDGLLQQIIKLLASEQAPDSSLNIFQVSVFIELTSLFILIEMMTAAVRLRRAEKRERTLQEALQEE